MTAKVELLGSAVGLYAASGGFVKGCQCSQITIHKVRADPGFEVEPLSIGSRASG